jgi:hypothetical protein
MGRAGIAVQGAVPSWVWKVGQVAMIVVPLATACADRPALAAPCPAPSDRGGLVAFAASQLARPHATDVIAGGRVALAACPAVPGTGHVTGDPDIVVDVAADTGPRGLEFRTAAACDTILLVATEDGAWHFDDDGGEGEDARIRLPGAGAGRYHVWIGTYDRGSCRARLIVEALR